MATRRKNTFFDTQHYTSICSYLNRYVAHVISLFKCTNEVFLAWVKWTSHLPFTVHLCLNLSLSMWILLQNNTVEPPPPLLWGLACVWLIKRLCAVSLWPSVMLCRGAWSLLTHSQTNEPLGENEIWCKCGCCCISCTRCHPGSKAKMNTDTQVASHESVYWTDEVRVLRNSFERSKQHKIGRFRLGVNTNVLESTDEREASPTFQWECLVRPWNAVIGPKSGLIWSQISSILLSLPPAPRKRTRCVWCQFKWPWLLFLQYCLSQCIRHLGSAPWSSASVSRDIMAASQHTWTEIWI